MDWVAVWGVAKSGGVVKDGGDDPGRAVGGSGDDAATGGVLFVDGERVEVDPVEDGERIGEGGFVAVAEILMKLVGASADLETAGKESFV